MATALMERSMSKRTDVAVKMDSEVARKAKIVAAYRGESLAEFLSAELGAIVDRLLEEEHAKERAATEPAKARSKTPKK